MAEQQLRQDKHGCYYLADAEPELGQVPTVPPMSQEAVKAIGNAIGTLETEIMQTIGVPTVAPAKRTRGPRKAAPTPIADAVTIPPPPPIIRG